ncbi:MAG: DegT/DnrJ/EryC1/StrS family aminotransferase [Acidobacteria bacterium]|nr:DegT/DnrJ/EryC1/StrS family aminotransferase [Acidobacteriota bacterium]
MQVTVPFQDLTLPAEVEREIQKSVEHVLHSRYYILGPEVELFEKEFAAYLGVRRVVAVASGTDAISLALLASGVVRPGAEVIVPALTSPFTAVAVLRAGAQPVFADVNRDTWTLDPASAAACVTDRTVALLPVHLYGNPADWDGLALLAANRGLVLVEDACQAHGAFFRGVRVGGLGTAAAFSFYPTKNLGAAGDGGAIATNDEPLAARCLHLRNGAQIRRYVHDQPVFHSRLDEVQAALLRVKLRCLDSWNEQRNRLCRRYREKLPHCLFPQLAPGAVPAAHLAVICLAQRDPLRAHLSQRGVETLIHYPVPLHRMPAFASCPAAPCPDAEKICEQLLSLPLHLSLSDELQDIVVRSIREFVPGK